MEWKANTNNNYSKIEKIWYKSPIIIFFGKVKSISIIIFKKKIFKFIIIINFLLKDLFLYYINLKL